MENLLANSSLVTRPSSYFTTLSFIWSRISGHLMNVSPIFSLFSSVFGLYRLLREIFGSSAAKCSTVFTTCVSLLYGAEQVVYSGVLELFL